ncbi:MAG: hypothetical protein M1831_001221 [Alyxoria varia]|nr:MAG: hypothetical protein M1831_001221 [Alyxoria varia]
MGSRGNGTTLYVTGFGHGTRARDLAFEFERTSSSRLFAFVEYESRRDADDAYYDMHNKTLGRDEVLKVEWARTPPSASWRFDPRERDRPPRRDRGDRSPRRRSRTPPPRSSRAYSPRKDDRRERDYDRRDRGRGRGRSRSPEDDLRDRDMKDRSQSQEEREPAGRLKDDPEEDRERKGMLMIPPGAHDVTFSLIFPQVSPPPRPAEDELDTAE